MAVFELFIFFLLVNLEIMIFYSMTNMSQKRFSFGFFFFFLGGGGRCQWFNQTLNCDWFVLFMRKKHGWEKRGDKICFSKPLVLCCSFQTTAYNFSLRCSNIILDYGPLINSSLNKYTIKVKYIIINKEWDRKQHSPLFLEITHMVPS